MTDHLRPRVAARLAGRLKDMQQGADQAQPADLALRAALRRGVHGSFGDNSKADAALLSVLRIPAAEDGDPPSMDARLGQLLDDASLVAALVAATGVRVREPGSRRSLGWDLRAIRARPASDDLLSAMLRANREELPRHLRRALTLMAADKAALDVDALLKDLEHWESDRRWVQKRWTYDFWSQAEARDGDNDKDEETA